MESSDFPVIRVSLSDVEAMRVAGTALLVHQNAVFAFAAVLESPVHFTRGTPPAEVAAAIREMVGETLG